MVVGTYSIKQGVTPRSLIACARARAHVGGARRALAIAGCFLLLVLAELASGFIPLAHSAPHDADCGCGGK